MYLKIYRCSVSFSIWTSSGTSQSSTWIIDLLSCSCSHDTELNLLQFNSCFHPKDVEQKVCCKNYMQFTYYGIINVMENALAFNTVLTGRYVQTFFFLFFFFFQYRTDLCVPDKLLLQQVLFWYCEHHVNKNFAVFWNNAKNRNNSICTLGVQAFHNTVFYWKW